MAPTVRTLKVTYGEENYHPVQYNGFKVGGIELVIEVPPNMTLEEAHELAFTRLETLVEHQFKRKLDTFMQRLQHAGTTMRTHAASKKS